MFRAGSRVLLLATAASACSFVRPSVTAAAADTDSSELDHVVILSGTASSDLSSKIAIDLNKSLGQISTRQFSDGEVHPRINESIRGKHVFFVQSCSSPTNPNVMELLLSIAAIRRADAATVTAVIPYFGYRFHRRGLPISTLYHSRFLWSAAGDLAKLLQTVGVDGVISVDLQRPGQGHEACFFDTQIPIETISANNAFVQYFVENIDLHKDVVVISPNTECVKKAQKFQYKLKASGKFNNVGYAAFLHDSPPDGNSADFYNPNNSEFLGDVKGADVIIVDDMIDTAGTLSILCRRLLKEGARRVYICASHGVFSQNSMQLIDLSPVEKVVVSDTISLPAERSKKIVQVSVSKLLAQVIAAEARGSSSIEQDGKKKALKIEEEEEDSFEAE